MLLCKNMNYVKKKEIDLLVILRETFLSVINGVQSKIQIIIDRDLNRILC